MRCKDYIERMVTALLLFVPATVSVAEDMSCKTIRELKECVSKNINEGGTFTMTGYVIVSDAESHTVSVADSTGSMMLTLAADTLWKAGDVVTFTAKAEPGQESWAPLTDALLTKVYDFNWREPLRTTVGSLAEADYGQLVLLPNVTASADGGFTASDGSPIATFGEQGEGDYFPDVPLDLIGIVCPNTDGESATVTPQLKLLTVRPHMPVRKLKEGVYRAWGNSIMWHQPIEWTTVITQDSIDPYKYWFDYIVSHTADACNKIYAIMRPDGTMLDLPTGQDFDRHSGTDPLSEDEFFGMYLDFDSSWIPEPKGTLLPITIGDDGRLVITHDCGVINHLRWAPFQYPDWPSLEWGARGIFYAGVTYTPPFPMIEHFCIEAHGNDALISWEKPAEADERGLIGFRIYCDNIVIGECDESQTNFTHQNLRQGTYTYAISCLYEDAESNLSPQLPFTMSETVSQWPRHIVVEEGTGTWCGNCPRGIEAMRLLHEKYPDTFIGISIHQGNDPMLNKPYADWLLNDGYVTVYPSSTVNRVAMDVDPYDDVLNGGLYDAALAQPLRATIGVSAEYVDNYDAILVTTTSRFALSSTDADRYRVGFVITENGVHQPDDEAYDQANYYTNGRYGEFYGWDLLPSTVPASNMYYNEVARSDNWFRGIDHSLPQAVLSQQDYTFTTTLPIPESVTCGDSITLIALLIDQQTGEILNAAKLPAQQFERGSAVPLFYEGFRYGIPAGFARHDIDGNQPFSSIGMQVGEAWGIKTDDTGNRYAYSTSYYSPSGTSDDWIVTTPISIPADGNYAITWRARSSSAQYKESYQLLLSTTGNQPEDFTALVGLADENDEWTERCAVMTLQGGTSVWVAFRNVTNNGEMLFLDDITVDKTDLSAVKDVQAATRNRSEACYDLNGRRLTDMPKQKGLYIITSNGKAQKICR